MLNPEPSLIVGLRANRRLTDDSSGVASCACLFFCLIRLRLLDSSGLELEWIAALETYTHPAFLGVSWLWSFLVLRDDLLRFLFEAYCLG